MENKSDLNKRQWALYNFLKDRGDEWTTQKTVAYALSNYYDVWFDDAHFHDSNVRKQITVDIRKINESGIIQKVIISGAKGIKIANAQEFERYTRKEIMSATRRLLRAKLKAEKGKFDGQMCLVFNSERDTVKAFLDSDKAIGERLAAARKEKGFTTLEVAQMLNIKGVDVPMLSKFERGHALPNKTTLAAMAEIYAVSVDYILTGILSTETQTGENNNLQVAKKAFTERTADNGR